VHRIRRLDSRVVLAAVFWLVPGGGLAAAQVMPPPEGAPTTPALTRLFDDEGKVERIASGFTFAQDVVWDGSAVIVVDGGSGRLVRVGVPAKVVLQEPGVAAVAVDAEGRLITASRGERHLVRIEEDGTRTVVVQRGDDAPLAAPIDLATGAGGLLLVADGASDERGWTGRVVEIDPDGSARTLVDGVGRPSGIALSPDGATLYVSDATRNELRAYALDGGEAGDARRLVSVIPWKRGVRGGPAR
jgi:gluconolactonase